MLALYGLSAYLCIGQSPAWVSSGSSLYTSPSSTYVGIGTTSPQRLLHIKDQLIPGDDPDHPVLIPAAIRLETALPNRVWDLTASSGPAYASPSIHTLQFIPVVGQAPKFTFTSDGRLGINGLPNFNTTLMVHGGGIFRNKLECSDPSAANKISFFHDGVNYRVESEGTGELLFNYGSGKRVVFHPDVQISSRLAIGTSNYTDGATSYALNVNGKIRAKEVKCYTGWADFVFEPHYTLMPLQELKKYTQQYKHLPDIPSEKEVSQNGINLAEMNAKLLQKIEEAYLYIFQLEQRITELEKTAKP